MAAACGATSFQAIAKPSRSGSIAGMSERVRVDVSRRGSPAGRPAVRVEALEEHVEPALRVVAPDEAETLAVPGKIGADRLARRLGHANRLRRNLGETARAVRRGDAEVPGMNELELSARVVCFCQGLVRSLHYRSRERR